MPPPVFPLLFCFLRPFIILSRVVTEEGFLPGNVVSCIAAILLAFPQSIT